MINHDLIIILFSKHGGSNGDGGGGDGGDPAAAAAQVKVTGAYPAMKAYCSRYPRILVLAPDARPEHLCEIRL